MSHSKDYRKRKCAALNEECLLLYFIEHSPEFQFLKLSTVEQFLSCDNYWHFKCTSSFKGFLLPASKHLMSISIVWCLKKKFEGSVQTSEEVFLRDFWIYFLFEKNFHFGEVRDIGDVISKRFLRRIM